MMRSGKLEGLGCFVPFLLLSAMFGFTFGAIPLALVTRISDLSQGPVGWLSMIATIVALFPYALRLRPRPLPAHSPYLSIPRPVGVAAVYRELTSPKPLPRLLYQYESPLEVSLILNWLAPLRTYLLLWLSAVLGGVILSWTDQLHLTWLEPLPVRFAVVALCMLPSLYRAPKDWALLEQRRSLDHRLLFDFENQRLALVDLQKLEDSELWSRPFAEVQVALMRKPNGSSELALQVSGQDKPLILACWPRKVPKGDAQVLREALAQKMGKAR
ncbi:MAG: hypothetical protein U0931_13525 [Vulcanimicrobiota bacterium]